MCTTLSDAQWCPERTPCLPFRILENFLQFRLHFLESCSSCFLIYNGVNGSGPGSSVGCVSAWRAYAPGFDPRVRQYSFIEIGHELISTAILSLPLIQVGQLSITDERTCT